MMGIQLRLYSKSCFCNNVTPFRALKPTISRREYWCLNVYYSHFHRVQSIQVWSLWCILYEYTYFYLMYLFILFGSFWMSQTQYTELFHFTLSIPKEGIFRAETLSYGIKSLILKWPCFLHNKTKYVNFSPWLKVIKNPWLSWASCLLLWLSFPLSALFTSRGLTSRRRCRNPCLNLKVANQPNSYCHSHLKSISSC